MKLHSLNANYPFDHFSNLLSSDDVLGIEKAAFPSLNMLSQVRTKAMALTTHVL